MLGLRGRPGAFAQSTSSVSDLEVMPGLKGCRFSLSSAWSTAIEATESWSSSSRVGQVRFDLLGRLEGTSCSGGNEISR